MKTNKTIIVNKDLQKDDQNKIYRTLKNYIPKQSYLKRNLNKSWIYGYDAKHDLVVISRDGTVGAHRICNANNQTNRNKQKKARIY